MPLLLFGCLLCISVMSASSFMFNHVVIRRQAANPRYLDSEYSCMTPSDRAGHCMPILQCRHLIQERNVNIIKKSMCGTYETEARVCCPNVELDDLPATPSNTSLKNSDDSSDHLISVPDSPSNDSTEVSPGSHSNQSSQDGRRKTPFPTDCGRSSATFRRIVGGQESSVGAWPWMAAVYYVRRSSSSAECGGVLVTNKHVMTAAHCVVSSRRGITMNPRQLRIRLGDHDIDSDKDGASPIDVSVASVIKHNRFQIRTFQNDIAILVLKSTVTFGKFISPICLPFHVFNAENLANKNAFAAGWGTTSYGGPASSKLQEVQLRIWENSKCERVFRKDVPITDANLCAGDEDKDACRGDSGGPLMLADNDGRFYLIGIVSFGKKCAEPGYPGVYTRITTFLDWIERKIESTM